MSEPADRATRRRRRRARWILGACVAAVIVASCVIGYSWVNSGAHPLSSSVAVERFRHILREGGDATGPGPAEGIYDYRGSGTEQISVPPKSQSEGPELPGTVLDRPGGCFEFRLDYSDAHWQSWNYCVRNGTLQTSSKAGYYLWDFVVFKVDDTSTYTCRPETSTVPAHLVVGTRSPVSCTGSNDHLSTGPVHMTGNSTVVTTSTLSVGEARLPAVLIREDVRFSGGQQGSNDADTWFSVATGLPLRGTWSTVVSTPSPVGISTLHAHGRFALASLTPRR